MTLATAQKQQSSVMNALAKAGDLKKRILFTILALIVFRFGTRVPLPGINLAAAKDIFSDSPIGNLLEMFNTFTGGALKNMSILALGIAPYITASIAVQMAVFCIDSLKAKFKEGGEAGQRKLNQYTRYIAIFFAITQGWGAAVLAEKYVVPTLPIFLFRFSAIVSILGGTFFVIWLSDQITQRGIGNGSSWIISAGILADVPETVLKIFELGRSGEYSNFGVIASVVITFALVMCILFIERAQRRIVIQYPKGMMANRMLNTRNSYYPLKINASSVMGPIFASAFLTIVLMVISFFAKMGGEGGKLQEFNIWLNNTVAAYMGLYAIFIVIFTFVYTSLSVDPKDMAEALKKNGGFVAGIRPGEATAKYFDGVISRLTIIAAAYLVVLCVVPNIIAVNASLRLILSGTSLLIVVLTIVETISQAQAYLVSYQYESLIRKAKLKGKI